MQAVVSDGEGRWLEDVFPISLMVRGEYSNTKSREILVLKNTNPHYKAGLKVAEHIVHAKSNSQ